jgi:hypothetical protein
MFMSRRPRFFNVVSLYQIDKIFFTIATASLMVFVVHMLPSKSAAFFGARWLVIFYAPLIAAIYYKRHVALIAALAVPFFNHLLFGMPDNVMWLQLTWELLIFSAILGAVKAKRSVHIGHVWSAIFVARLFTFFVAGNGAGLGRFFLNFITLSWPGLVTLAVVFYLAGKIKEQPHAQD